MRKSIIRDIPIQKLRAIVARAESMTDIVRAVGLVKAGGSITNSRKVLLDLGLDLSHIPVGKSRNRGIPSKRRMTVGRLLPQLVKGSGITRYNAKRHVIAFGLLPNVCDVCKMLPSWLGKPLVLVLDHINGVNDDYRMENLRLLCPNCNSQTSTFAGRNIGRNVTG